MFPLSCRNLEPSASLREQKSHFTRRREEGREGREEGDVPYRFPAKAGIQIRLVLLAPAFAGELKRLGWAFLLRALRAFA